eukprot:scaffold5939_cov143-Skeletonema_dohrnii-CCMP3373.AAC.1
MGFSRRRVRLKSERCESQPTMGFPEISSTQPVDRAYSSIIPLNLIAGITAVVHRWSSFERR